MKKETKQLIANGMIRLGVFLIGVLLMYVIIVLVDGFVNWQYPVWDLSEASKAVRLGLIGGIIAFLYYCIFSDG